MFLTYISYISHILLYNGMYRHCIIRCVTSKNSKNSKKKKKNIYFIKKLKKLKKKKKKKKKVYIL